MNKIYPVALHELATTVVAHQNEIPTLIRRSLFPGESSYHFYSLRCYITVTFLLFFILFIFIFITFKLIFFFPYLFPTHHLSLVFYVYSFYFVFFFISPLFFSFSFPRDAILCYEIQLAICNDRLQADFTFIYI